jgi:transcriptional regulator with XRE-family HTH domain
VAPTEKQIQDFGQLLRDRRDAAGLSRAALGRLAKMSDATIKLTEAARQPPSRATLIRLIGVEQLRLTWADVPGQPTAPAAEPTSATSQRAETVGPPWHLNCFVAPSYDSLALVAEFSRFLTGAGGHLEQSTAYLEHQSAVAYLSLCRNSLAVADLRARLPLAQAAKQIRAVTGPAALQVIALGAGDGVLEVRLARHLLDERAPAIDLCLLDISQPLLNCALGHAAEVLADVGNARAWGVQCDFHQLPLYPELFHSPTVPRPPRLYCLLGGTLANLDQEPRFLQQCLLPCEPGDLLLLDIESVSAPIAQETEIRRRDKLFRAGVPPHYAAWLSGPLWRHCGRVTSIELAWAVDTHCPVPGSYALHAVATVQSPERPDRRFSVFRFSRYDPALLGECLRLIGWDEMSAIPYAGEHSLRLYRKRGQ